MRISIFHLYIKNLLFSSTIKTILWTTLIISLPLVSHGQFWWYELEDAIFHQLHRYEDNWNICRGYNIEREPDKETVCYKAANEHNIVWNYLQNWQDIYSKWRKLWKWKAIFHNKIFLEFDGTLLSDWEIFIEQIWDKTISIINDHFLVINRDLYHSKIGLIAKWFWQVLQTKKTKPKE